MNQRNALKQLEMAYLRHDASNVERNAGIKSINEWLNKNGNFGMIETFAKAPQMKSSDLQFHEIKGNAVVQRLPRHGYDLYITIKKLQCTVPSRSFMTGVAKRLDLVGAPSSVMDVEDDSHIPYIEHAIEGGFVGI